MTLEQSTVARATSLWSVLSWVFFGLVVLSALAFGVYGLVFRSASTDPQAGPLLGIPMLVGMGAAWGVAWASSLVGTLFGLVGVLAPAHRTSGSWVVLFLNGTVALVTTVLLFVLG